MWVEVESVFFNGTAPPEIYPLPLHDALPISARRAGRDPLGRGADPDLPPGGDLADARRGVARRRRGRAARRPRSEEHTSELQSRQYLVCRLLLEKRITS